MAEMAKTDKKVYTAFINKGEVPVNAFKLLGASSKRGDDSKIGYFGSGLKYAIAVLLRQGVDFKVYSGLKEVKIGTRTTDFLNQKIQVITINGEKTSITLDAGIDWEGWFAIRELYSNALDEGGNIETEAIKPEAGFTKIYIDSSGNRLGDVFRNWQKYFTNKRPSVYEDNVYGRILPKISGDQNFVVFRKGIRAYDRTYPSIYDYDLAFLDINESRIAKHTWQVWENCSRLLAKSSLEVIESFVNLSSIQDFQEYTEWQDEFWSWGTSRFSEAWLEAIADRELIPSRFAGHFLVNNKIPSHQLVLPDRLIEKLRDFFGIARVKLAGEDKSYFVCADQSGVKDVEVSLKRIAMLGYNYRGSTPTIVAFKDFDCRGSLDDNGILISEKLIGGSEDKLDSVVLEEIIHYGLGYDDLSRPMQNWLFDEVIRLGKENLEREKKLKEGKKS